MNGDLQIGDVLSRSVSTYFANIIPFTAIAAIVTLPSLLLQLGHLPFDSKVLTQLCNFSASMWSLVAGYVISGFVTYAAFNSLKGVQLTASEAASKAMSRLPAVALTGLLMGAIIFAGSLACFVPGIIASLFLYVAVPAAVIEGRGPVDALQRSAELTEGHKLNIFLMWLLIAGCFGLVACGLGSMGAALGGVIAKNMGAVGLKGFTGGTSIVSYLLSAFISGFGATLVAVVYHDLRQLREGSSVDDLLAVFR